MFLLSSPPALQSKLVPALANFISVLTGKQVEKCEPDIQQVHAGKRVAGAQRVELVADWLAGLLAGWQVGRLLG